MPTSTFWGSYWEEKNVRCLLIEKLTGRGRLDDWENDTNMDTKEIIWENVELIHLFWGREKWRGVI